MIFLGLDVGQAADYTAINADEVTMEKVGVDDWGNKLFDIVHRIRHVERFALGISYPLMAERVLKMLENPLLKDCKLAIDATGVGRPVVDMLRVAKQHLYPVVITGGVSETFDQDTGFWHIPKRELVSKVQVVLGNGRLRFAKLPENEIIKREFYNFKLKINNKGHDTYEAWRDGDHDDLVLSVALSVWFGEKYRDTIIREQERKRKTEKPALARLEFV